MHENIYFLRKRSSFIQPYPRDRHAAPLPPLPSLPKVAEEKLSRDLRNFHQNLYRKKNYIFLFNKISILSFWLDLYEPDSDTQTSDTR